MLFNSHIFLLAFLPMTLAGFYLLGRLGASSGARVWLLAASLIFYAWWSVPFLFLIVATILFNYVVGNAICERATADRANARRLTIFGITVDLALLGWFKYSAFVLENVSALTGVEFAVRGVILPLAISFHTFQQIVYLVEARRGNAERYGLLEYSLFVMFFPQLIAGPIVHHNELIPQLRGRIGARFPHQSFAAGVAFVLIGLVKKVVIADSVTELTVPVFDAPGETTPAFVDAWIAVGAFAVGLYFDFSGYSDMAVGLARMFGIQLPYNFNSPYQARSISEFWRRWHMTLSRFLRDYVYVPLGGNRHGEPRRYLNLMITMLLGGLWHGAAWTFVAWGALHGLYLAVDHAWAHINRRFALLKTDSRARRVLAHLLTLLAVTFAWVFFRAPTFERAGEVVAGMLGAHGGISAELAARLRDAVVNHGFVDGVSLLDWWIDIYPLAVLIAGCAIALALPNSQQIVDGWRRDAEPAAARDYRWRFRPGAATAVAAAIALLFTLTLMSKVKEFVYFQF